MNLLLVRHDFSPALVSLEHRIKYHDAPELLNDSKFESFDTLVTEVFVAAPELQLEVTHE